MGKNFLIKKFSQNNIKQELSSIKFDESYLDVAKYKYETLLLKIYDLTPIQATILKQTALSVGTDCATSYGVLTHSEEKSDCILAATKNQLQKIIEKLSLQPFGLKFLAEDLKNYNEKCTEPVKINNKIFDWKKTYIMGILNCTPDSFSDGGKFNNEENAIKHFSDMITYGADIIDFGAESTAPGNNPISQETEISRLNCILKKCRTLNDIPISVDTRNASTAKTALEEGVDIINDVSGLTYDENMLSVILDKKPFVILTFNDEIKTSDTIDETIKGLLKRVKMLTDNGFDEHKIIVDAGLGFNKTFEQNLELIKNADEICSLGFPVLYGISRKSFVQKMTGLKIQETENANVSLATYLAGRGVNIIRVHDVLRHKIAFKVLDLVIHD